jgi:hypothetical protein
MSFKVSYKHGPKLSVVEVSGLAFADRAQATVQEIRDLTLAHGDRRLLINLLDVVGTMGPQEHHALGLLAAQYFGHLERVASLVAEDKITRVSEAAAQKKGMQLRVFTNLTEAIDWLVS